jgi:hypothetical protein
MPKKDKGQNGQGGGVTISNSKVIYAYVDENDNNVYREGDFGAGFSGAENALKSHLQCLAVFVGRLQGAQDFWDAFTGSSCYTVTEDADGGLDVYAHDSSGQGLTRVRHYNPDGTAVPFRAVDSKVSQAVMGGGATADTFGNGTGNTYVSKTNAAIDYVNATYNPSAPIPHIS